MRLKRGLMSLKRNYKNVYSSNSTCLFYDATLCRCLKIMTEEAIDELMLDIIEIVNPIGDAYTDLLTRFNEFINEFEKEL